MNTIKFNGINYPELQSQGFAAQYASPFAKKILKGEGYDIGCNRLEWAYPTAKPIDPVLDPKYDAMNLPDGEVDYIFSSHMAEHFVGNFANLFDYWRSKLKIGGVLFLYLPNYDYQEYWRCWNHRKHIHCFTPKILKDYLSAGGWDNIFVTEGADLNASFYAVAQKSPD